MKYSKIILIILLLLLCLNGVFFVNPTLAPSLHAGAGLARNGGVNAQRKFSGVPKLLIFYSPSCEHCFKVRAEFMPRIEARYKGVIDVEYLDIGNIENYKLLLSLQEQYPLVNRELPILFMAGRFLDERVHTYAKIEAFVAESLGKVVEVQEPYGEIDLISHFLSFTVFTIVAAGLIDGINPCAFTVIVFFVAFLSVQRYRKREIFAVGLSFIFAVFLTYLSLGVGVFRILYTLKAFYIVKKIIYFAVALVCFTLFLFTLYDIYRFKKSGNVEDVVLRLPHRLKNLIHRIIGVHYRQRGKDNEEKWGVIGLVLSAVSCGFLVSLLEAVCTGQVYLPTIAFVLKTSELKVRALAYLILYNIMFIIPLLIIFLLALFGVTSAQFANFLQRHLVLTKILLAAVFFLLAVLLIMGI